MGRGDGGTWMGRAWDGGWEWGALSLRPTILRSSHQLLSRRSLNTFPSLDLALIFFIVAKLAPQVVEYNSLVFPFVFVIQTLSLVKPGIYSGMTQHPNGKQA